MENDKVEVPTALLDKLFGFIQQPFLNAKGEDKKEEKEEDDDKMEHDGEIYSKKELVNCYKAKMNELAEEEKEGKEKEEKEEEKKNSIDADVEEKVSDDDMEFFNSMQKLMAESQSDASDKVEVPSQTKGLELGSKAFG